MGVYALKKNDYAELSGYTYVIATCQDAGTAILVASLSGTSLKVIFSNQITIARVNFLLLTA